MFFIMTKQRFNAFFLSEIGFSYTDIQRNFELLFVKTHHEKTLDESKKGDKDKESIQSRTKPGPGYHMGK